MNKIGLVLISLSFLVGAYLSVLHTTEVNWSLFLVVFAVGLTGVALARIGSKTVATSADVLESNLTAVRQSLENIVRHVSALNNEKETILTYDMSKEIDSRVLDDLNDFVESRSAITHTYGLQAYAEVMSHYAGGERYLNRVWSASADGYVNEVKNYLERSLEQFQIAREKLSGLRDPSDDQTG
ncbi:MAG: hypothetical protein BMS9Abin05_0151 [Rhodothermia bacterium]|nr:MAG: hypothetical protein BMS9Abin05_0151 [Rhodothermia bacterium]